MRRFRSWIPALAGAFLFPCAASAATPVSITYHTKSIVELRGQVDVADFAYVPVNPKHKPNQIPNTALGGVMLDKTIGAFLADGLRQELRTSGVSLLPGGQCKLSGTVKAIRIDDLGLDSDFSLSADYVLTGPGGEIYRHEQTTAFMASKFGGGATSISKLFSDNINAVIGAEDFTAKFEAGCPRVGG